MPSFKKKPRAGQFGNQDSTEDLLVYFDDLCGPQEDAPGLLVTNVAATPQYALNKKKKKKRKVLRHKLNVFYRVGEKQVVQKHMWVKGDPTEADLRSVAEDTVALLCEWRRGVVEGSADLMTFQCLLPLRIFSRGK